MEENWKVLGAVDHYGRVRTLWSNGATLTSTAWHYPEVGERKRMRCAMAVRYGDEK